MDDASKLTTGTDEATFYVLPCTTVGQEEGTCWATVVDNSRAAAEERERDAYHLTFDISDGARVGNAADAC